MDFGRLPSLDGVEFVLAPDAAPTRARLAAGARDGAAGSVRVGCPAWATRGWVRDGGLYPRGTRPADYLARYAEQLSCVELNATFYGLPSRERLAAWRDATPPTFRFVPKLSREIASARRAGPRAALTALDAFLAAVEPLGERLGACFWQLGPEVAPADLPFVEAVVAHAAARLPLVVELRHPAWFDGRALRAEVADLLAGAGAGTVIADTAGRRDAAHGTLTAPRVLVRFQGHEGHPTDATRLDAWAERLAAWSRGGVDAWFIAHQPEELLGPDTCGALASRLARHGIDAGVRGPLGLGGAPPAQRSLFS